MAELFIFGVIFAPVILTVALVERFGDHLEKFMNLP